MQTKYTGGSFDELPPRLLGRCLSCNSEDRTRAAQGVRHDGMPPNSAKWLCVDCADLVACQPGIAPAVERAAAVGIPYREAVRVFAALGMEPPTDAAGVAELFRRVMRAA